MFIYFLILLFSVLAKFWKDCSLLNTVECAIFLVFWGGTFFPLKKVRVAVPPICTLVHFPEATEGSGGEYFFKVAPQHSVEIGTQKNLF